MFKDLLQFLNNFLFRFDGRSNRAKMLVFTVWWLLIIFAIDQLTDWFAQPERAEGLSWPHQVLGYFSMATEAALGLLLLYCYAAVATKRLHDRDWSAWLLTVLCGAQLARSAINETAPGASFVAVATWIASAWIFVELYLLPGTRGSNRFGPDPLPLIKETSPEQH